MRILLLLCCVLAIGGCSRMSLDHHLNKAYQAYDRGDCEDALLYLSQAERVSRSRSYIQPEISLLRGQSLYLDAAQTYQFIIGRYPASEYAFRARARLETLRQLGHHGASEPAKVSPAGTL